MTGTKDKVRALLDRLSDDCSLDEVMYHLYVNQKVEAGLSDAAEGHLFSHAEVADGLRLKWLKDTAA
jgi:predicted transcriptional regulator